MLKEIFYSFLLILVVAGVLSFVFFFVSPADIGTLVTGEVVGEVGDDKKPIYVGMLIFGILGFVVIFVALKYQSVKYFVKR